ncbi:pilin [Streptomyces acidiscabies]|uniref:Pilin n=2 Tax=Streptomyces acidiscabies TaxID=42234 RepID=A0ABU4MCR0_9ACTN|nr:pilin [Streptomyces acidiscabies]MDX3025910.1 pilin [Streptomyces acidiscabies]MDX3796834.1 pilin [Streptomyces acidiscabies]GAQ58491.1 TrbC/VIRB2 family protein [Streptomyces acidiscabies]GAV45610.1 TrbC/VIRB2 family protein [Streptomyces acidiscabies]
MRQATLLRRLRHAAAQGHAALNRALVLDRHWTLCWLVTTGTVLLLVCLLGASSASAAGPGQTLGAAASVNEVLTNIRNWIMGIAATLATVFLSIGGLRYMTAGGDPGEVEKAKTAFRGAGWGYGIVVLAPLIVEILKGIVGA